MFPVSLEGSVHFAPGVRLNADTKKAVVNRIVDMLDEADASSVTTEGYLVRFTVDLRRPVGNWNILVPFNGGTIAVEAETERVRVRYDLNTKRILIFVTGAVAALGAFMVFAHPEKYGPLTVLPYLIPGWLWLFGMNYVTSMIRVPRWLRRGLRDLPELRRQ